MRTDGRVSDSSDPWKYEVASTTKNNPTWGWSVGSWLTGHFDRGSSGTKGSLWTWLISFEIVGRLFLRSSAAHETEGRVVDFGIYNP